MEKVGTGIKRMETLCKKNNNAIVIKPLSTHFFLEMESLKGLLPGDNIKDGLRDGLSDGIKDGIKLNKIQQDILSEIHRERNITIERLAEKVGISVRNIEKNIARLKEEGHLKRIGSRKTGYWEVKSNEIQAKATHEKTGSEEERKRRAEERQKQKVRG